jgi:hypothetical protein
VLVSKIDVETKVRAVLETAGLNVSDEELAVFVRMYPKIRTVADSLYIPETEYEDSALIFSAAW